jgi:excisionase family DNA binding protein
MAFQSTTVSSGKGHFGCPRLSPDILGGSKMDSDIITVKEAAARLHVAVNTIYNWITDGRLTYQDGLFRVRRRTLFHWPTLKARALSGSLDPNHGEGR